MEIIERGVLPNDRKYTCTCNTCKTKFRFNRDEAKFVSCQRDGDYLTIPCPVCKYSVYKDPNGYDK